MRFTAETRGCLKHQISSGLHEGMDVPTDDFLRGTKIPCMHRFNKFSYPWCSAGRALRARVLRYYSTSVSRVQIFHGISSLEDRFDPLSTIVAHVRKYIAFRRK